MFTKLLAYVLGAIFLIGLGAVPAWYYTQQYEVNKYTAQIEKANQEADQKLIDLTVAKGKVEIELYQAKNDIQNKYEKAIRDDQETIAKLHATNTRLQFTIANKDREHASAGNPGSTSGSDNTGSTTVVLPQPISDAILSLALRADSVSEQLRACQSWVATTQAALDKWKKDNKIK